MTRALALDRAHSTFTDTTSATSDAQGFVRILNTRPKILRRDLWFAGALYQDSNEEAAGGVDRLEIGQHLSDDSANM
jgi:hypothetical protein